MRHTLRGRMDYMSQNFKIATAIIFGEPESVDESEAIEFSNRSKDSALTTTKSDQIDNVQNSRSLFTFFLFVLAG